MAEARVTQAGQYVEEFSATVQVTQAGQYVEYGLDEVRATQMGVYTEIEYIQPDPPPRHAGTVNYARDRLGDIGSSGNRSSFRSGGSVGGVHTRGMFAEPVSDGKSPLRRYEQNQGNRMNHMLLPEEVTGYALDNPDSFWKVVMPEATENLMYNPSFEDFEEADVNGDIAAIGYGIEDFAEWGPSQSHLRGGFYSQYMITGAGDTGQIYSSNQTVGTPGFSLLTAGQYYTWSFDLHGSPAHTYYAEAWDGTVAAFVSKQFTKKHGGWERITLTFRVPTSGVTVANVRVKLRAVGASTAIIYTDCWQLENKSYATTYCDGDLRSYVGDPNPYAYAWTGRRNQSPSVRAGTTANGGRLVSLAEFGLRTTVVSGLGAEELEVEGYGIRQQGDIYKAANAKSREFTITGKIYGKNHQELGRLRKGLIDALRPRRFESIQPIRLFYQPMNSRGVAMGKPIYIDCICKGGLAGNMTNLYQETLAISFVAFDTQFYADGVEGVDTIVSPAPTNSLGLALRDRNQNWSTGSGTSNGIINSAVYDQNGFVVVGGTFTSFAGVSIDRLATNASGSWVEVDQGLNGVVNDLATAEPLGRFSWDEPGRPAVAVVGDFTADGLAAPMRRAVYIDDTGDLVQMGSGLDAEAWAVVAYRTGDFFIGGEFINDVDNTVLVNYITRYAWETDTFTVLDGGMNDHVYALVLKNDTLYAGGKFTVAGGVGVNRVAQYSIADDAWAALDNGFNLNVLALEIGPDGYLYAGGEFTEDAFGDRPLRYLARWNGRSWEEVGGGLGAKVWHLKTVGKYLYVSGEFTAGVAGYPAWGTNYLARWDGNQWVPSDYVSTNVASLPRLHTGRDGRTALAAFQSYTGNYGAESTVVTVECADVRPLIYLAPEATYYEVTNLTTGQSIFFKKLMTAAGEYCILDFTQIRPRFYSNYRADLSAYILASASNYNDFRLAQGDNIIKVLATTTGSTASVTTTLRWREAYRSYDDAGII